MIKRNKYAMEYRKKIGIELSLGQITVSALSKREGVSVQTLTKWRDRYGLSNGMQRSEIDSSEVKELKKLLTEYEAALGEMALQNHILKKMQEFTLAREKRKSSLGVISPSMLGSKGAVR